MLNLSSTRHFASFHVYPKMNRTFEMREGFFKCHKKCGKEKSTIVQSIVHVTGKAIGRKITGKRSRNTHGLFQVALGQVDVVRMVVQYGTKLEVRPSLDFRRRFRIEHCHQTLYTFYVIRRF
jgi:hypothetical protein